MKFCDRITKLLLLAHGDDNESVTRMRKSERLAQRIIQAELGVPVEQHDDGTEPGMFDLRIGPKDAPEIAIECVGAVDQVLTQTWNTGPARGPFSIAVKGDWRVEIKSGASIRRIREQIGPILRELEMHQLLTVDSAFVRGAHERKAIQKLGALGISHASCFRIPGEGQVHMGMEGAGGAVDITGTALPAWIDNFLRQPARADVLKKLVGSNATERHVFVLVEYGGAPWEVQTYFWYPISHLPPSSSQLPHPVTSVWIGSTLGPHGVRWTGTSWSPFSMTVEGSS